MQRSAYRHLLGHHAAHCALHAHQRRLPGRAGPRRDDVVRRRGFGMWGWAGLVLLADGYRPICTHALNSFYCLQTFADRTLGVAARLMPIFVMCSTLGTINGYILMQSRLIFAGARKGQLPDAFSLVNTVHMTPVVAIVVHVSLATKSSAEPFLL